MNSYMMPTIDNFQALDFTSKYKNKMEKPDPVLDLSFKKQPIISTNFGPIKQDSSLNSSLNSSSEEHHLASNLTPNSDGKGSPFEVRSYMVTPPSEAESLKKPKFDQIYNPITVLSVDQIGHKNYQSAPIHLPMPIVPTIPTVPSSSTVSTISTPTAVSVVTAMPTVPAVPRKPAIPAIPTVPTLPTVPAALPSLVNQNNNLLPQIQMPKATSTIQDHATVPSDCNKKAARPFKAYPKDPLSLSVVSEIIYDQNSNDAYSEFRKKMLDSVRRTSDGTNIKMRRISKSPGLPTSTMDDKDNAYWERRRKNNEAAKRSRDARRAKEDEIAIRAAFLEQENLKLKYELVALRNETAKLRCLIYSN